MMRNQLRIDSWHKSALSSWFGPLYTLTNKKNTIFNLTWPTTHVGSCKFCWHYNSKYKLTKHPNWKYYESTNVVYHTTTAQA